MNALLEVAGLGLDSFLACLISGCCGPSRREALGLAGAFGVCDAAASLFGSIWPLPVPPLAALGVYLVCPMMICASGRRRTALYGLPILLSLDNLCTATPPAAAPLLGAGSALMALAGLRLADVARSSVRAPIRSER
jgi:hypothetical protein